MIYTTMTKDKQKITLREFLHVYNALGHESIDVSVDGTGFCIAVEFGEIRFTKEAQQHFADALDKLYMYDESCITTDVDEHFDEYEEKGTGPIALAVELVAAMAGYCSCSDFEKWFDGRDAELV